VELAALLALMLLGYTATRSQRRIGREVAFAFLGWAAVFAALFVLISLPDVLVWVFRVAMGAAVGYAAWALAHALVHWFAGVPALAPVHRSHTARMLRRLPPPARRAGRSAFREACGAAGRDIAFQALTEAVLEGAAPDDVGPFVRRRAMEIRDANAGLVERLRIACGSKGRFDATLVNRLTLRFGPEAVTRALARLEGRPRPHREALPRLAREEARDVERATLLRETGWELPLPRGVGAGRPGVAGRVFAWVPFLEMITGILLPLTVLAVFTLPKTSVALVGWLVVAYLAGTLGFVLWAYASVGRLDRGALFAIAYVALLAYGAVVFPSDRERGWMFLAVVALLHVAALVQLGPLARAAPQREGGRKR